MLNKRAFFIFLLLIIMIGAISSVSANDLDDDMVNETNHDEIGIEEDINDLSENDVETLSEAGEADILEKSYDGTFTQLQNKISFSSEGSTLYLDEDYSFNNDFAGYYGISFSKSITIEGNNHIIDGLSKSRIFSIYGAKNVVLKDIMFVGGLSTGHGGAIYAERATNISIINCSFVGNVAEGYGGAIFAENVKNFSIVDSVFIRNYASQNDAMAKWVLGEDVDYDDFDFGEDLYVQGTASNGGAICLSKVEHSIIDSCYFNYNFAIGAGGTIFFCDLPDALVLNSTFLNGFAEYAGFIYTENSTCVFKNVDMNYSYTFLWGGMFGTRWSDITLDSCNLYHYQSTHGPGGAIYNFLGNLLIKNSSFTMGFSHYGGAIANSQANLTILSSRFINHTGGYGGAIYSNRGHLYVNGSFFNNSEAQQGSAIFGMLSNSLTFTNNIFLNSTGGQFIIYSEHSKKDIVELGNHFENIYHVRAEYTGSDEGDVFIVTSKTLNYVVSNDGTYLNTYKEEPYIDIFDETVSFYVYDEDYPDNTTIYGDFKDVFHPRFNFDKYYDVDDDFKNLECIYIRLFSDSNLDNQLEQVTNIRDSFYIQMNMSCANRTAMDFQNLIGFSGIDTPIPIINSSLSGAKAIPSAYDSRDYDYITPVKDQGLGGNCWAFAGIATLEACIKKATGITYDFSENNPKNLMAMDSITGLNKRSDSGGIDSMMMAYLTSWLGPIKEKTETYDIYSSISAVYASLFHVQNIKFLPARKNSLDNDAFKQAIMDYGAVSVSLDLSEDEFHAVCLVGWDDNYNDYDSLGKYTKGAWIFKNSWGSQWADHGYGYLSYSTPFLSDLYDFYHAYTFIFNKTGGILVDGLLRSYQYDYSGVTDYICSDGYIYYKNKFICNETSDFDEVLIGFSTYFKVPTNYTVGLYINGYLQLSECGYRDAGYYTIPFSKIYDIEKGDEIVIEVINHNEGKNYAPVCQFDETSIANIRPNTSFVSFDGEKWRDLYDLKRFNDFLYDSTKFYTSQVACIKAFTSWYERIYEEIYVTEFDSVDVNKKVRIDISFENSIYNGGHYSVEILKAIEGGLVTITINGKDYYAMINDGKASLELSFDKGGEYTASVYYDNDRYMSNLVEFNFTVNKNDAFISANDLSKVYGGSEKSVITLRDDKGNFIKDEVVYFTVNGKTTEIKTNDLGQASMPINLNPDKYVATISYGGNDVLEKTSKTVTITVKKATPKITASKKTFKKKDKTKKYTVTLKDNKNKAIKGATIKITVNKKTYTAKTNKKGIATFKLNKLTKKGKSTATVKYAGSKVYNSKTVKVQLTVK